MMEKEQSFPEFSPPKASSRLLSVQNEFRRARDLSRQGKWETSALSGDEGLFHLNRCEETDSFTAPYRDYFVFLILRDVSMKARALTGMSKRFPQDSHAYLGEAMETIKPYGKIIERLSVEQLNSLTHNENYATELLEKIQDTLYGVRTLARASAICKAYENPVGDMWGRIAKYAYEGLIAVRQCTTEEVQEHPLHYEMFFRFMLLRQHCMHMQAQWPKAKKKGRLEEQKQATWEVMQMHVSVLDAPDDMLKKNVPCGISDDILHSLRSLRAELEPTPDVPPPGSEPPPGQ